MNNPLSALALVKGNREPHEAKKKSFDLSGNRTHDLRITSTAAPPTELQGRTEKVGDDLDSESRRRGRDSLHCICRDLTVISQCFD